MAYSLTEACKRPIVLLDGAPVRLRATDATTRMERPHFAPTATMSNMPAKVTRTELIIIVAALLVLVFSNRAPQPGSAEVRVDAGQATENVPNVIPSVGSDNPPSSVEIPPATVSSSEVQLPTDTPPAPLLPAQPSGKRYAQVDARNSKTLGHKGVMYGEVTARWVWNGTTFVLRKVCEVKEPGGATSVWSFDEPHEGITLTELPRGELPPNW